ncbi:MAG: hypothetical protein ACLS3Y_12895, partial [Collinsella sp.]
MIFKGDDFLAAIGECCFLSSKTGLEQPTGRFWQTDRRERTNMHHRVDAVTTASYPIVHQQTTHASKPHLNRSI